MRKPIEIAAVFGVMAALAAVAAEPRLVLSGPACRTMVEHRPAPGVAYTPGIDARGRPVAPADLPGGPRPPIDLDRLVVDITALVFPRFGYLPGFDIAKGEMVIGAVTLRDGRAYINGQALTPDEEERIAALCAERLARPAR